MCWKEIKINKGAFGSTDNFKLKKFLFLILAVNFLSIAIFITTDLLLFYISFEAILIPMYKLIGFFGSRNKKENAQNVFLLYTLFGS